MPTNTKSTPQPLPITPVEAWKSGFDYAFGFQIELFLGLFGLRAKKKD